MHGLKGTCVSEPLMLQALAGTRTSRPPFWLMRQAGRYLPEYRAVRAKRETFLEVCLDPELATEVTLQPVRRFAPDAAIVFSDILVIPVLLGRGVRFVEGTGPVLDAIEGVQQLAPLPARMDASVIGPVYETVARVRAALPDELALIGFAGGPWTVATYMVEGGSSRDYLRTRRWLYADPEGFATLIDVLVEATIAHLDAQIEAGAQVVKLFDSWAGVLAPRAFERWCIAPTRRIVAALHRCHPDVPVIGFPRGAGAGYAEFARGSGVDAVAIDTSVPPEWAARVLQPLVPVQGNLDPVALVAGGEAMAGEVRAITRALSRGAHIFNLGHGVLPATPPDHVGDLAELLRSGTV